MKTYIRILSFVMLLAAKPCLAGGFYIQEQSVSGLGQAFAGVVTGTGDASTIYYNPAGMTDLKEMTYSLGTHVLIPNASLKNKGSTISSTVGTGGASAPLTGVNTDNPYSPAAVPNAYLAFPVTLDRKIWAGIGVSAPFGLTNEYDSDHFARYDSTENELITINIAPSVAAQITNWLSVGAGLDIQYAEAKLENAVPSPITAGGPNTSTDGLQDLSGDDVSYGFNAGAILTPVEGTRLAAHYRQGISHKLKGRVITRIPSDVPGVGGTINRNEASAVLDLPNIITVGFSQDVTKKLKILGHVAWFEWSKFDDIPITLDNGTLEQKIQKYKDTWSFALGAQYQMQDNLTLKTGIQYDQTPTQDNFRTTRIPDGDRRWIAAGATYELNDRLSMDLSAAYIDVSEERVNLTENVPIGAASSTYTIDGVIEGDVGIISAGLNYKISPP